ncbi:YpdA family putative bacillithiol disulfide reductase [Echinicola jeungdonensis]|uniref:YpdA family putative bacillithiol disulfide reductase n=1 Tax=Echinicola jeungdonensis TaxID=709343 RepID=A0ABV5J7Q1_9BACT|nr:YpdA family putative bacillithiol disulfide reductase [Echinicola jeungdonensis]MDN3669688.1 YpdA family putative bacillithiol disulfide reductase [Echinicola jeungdonensis]
MKKVDVLIVGAGPIGLACGIEAEKYNLDYVILEKGTLANSIFNYPVNMTFFSTSDKLELGGIPFMSINRRPTRPEALEYYRRVTDHYQLKVKLYEEVKKLQKEGDYFVVKSSKETYLAEKVILSTGFYDLANKMNVPGEDLDKVTHYYKEPWPYIGQKVIVVGGGNSAVDVALEVWRKGAEVTMVMMNESVDRNVKYWVLPDIENRIKEGSIKAYFNTKIKEIRENEVVLDTGKGEETVPNDFVLAMTGYQPNYELLDQLGVHLTLDEKRRPCFDSNSQESNIPGLYLAGVVCGGLNTREYFIENTIIHAHAIFEDIMTKRSPISK